MQSLSVDIHSKPFTETRQNIYLKVAFRPGNRPH